MNKVQWRRRRRRQERDAVNTGWCIGDDK